MGYTLSFDASEKCKLGDINGLSHHIGREVDNQNGKEVRHSNQDINPARTPENLTMVGYGGELFKCKNTEQIRDAMMERLLSVKKPLRRDAIALRPLILQIDPEWYAAHQGEQERRKAMNDMLDWAEATFGKKNIVYAAYHVDESNPHLHVGFCPVTDDGRLSQKDWFSSPAALREMHQDFREFMRDRGYDIELGRKKPGKYAKRLSVEEYKDFQELEKERQALEADRRALEADRRALEEAKIQIQRERREAQEALQEAVQTLSDCKQYRRTIAEQQEARRMEATCRKMAERAAQAAELLPTQISDDGREKLL